MRSSKNCDLQSANVDGQTDRFKANYSIDLDRVESDLYSDNTIINHFSMTGRCSGPVHCDA